ncbi:MAG: hypothetical protein ACFFED_11005 [Candidatus Thorarchaeota archaeon]
MQVFINLGLIAAWTGLIFVAWLLVRERGIKDRDLCAACAGVTSALSIIWLLGTLIFLLTPSGIYFDFFLEGYNVLLIVPPAIICIDLLRQIMSLRASD